MVNYAYDMFQRTKTVMFHKVQSLENEDLKLTY